MQNKPTTHEQYSDLLSDTVDPNMLRFVEQLHTDVSLAYHQQTPPADLARTIDRMIAEQKQLYTSQHRTASWFWPQTRLTHRFASVLVVLGMLFALAGVTYAAYPLLEQVFGVRTGTGAIWTYGLGKELNISQRVDGFTITVRHVYADPNQIVIVYTLAGPPGRTFNHIMAWGDFDKTPGHERALSPYLFDADGNPFFGGVGGVNPGMRDGVETGILSYNGLGLQPGVTEIQAQLWFGKLSAYEELGNDQFQDVIVEGPVVFDLTIPVEAGRMADVQQTSVAGGAAVTLERVVTAPTGTRISVRGAGPNANVQLTVAGETYVLHPPDGQATPMEWEPDSIWEYMTGQSLLHNDEEWTLTITPAQPLSEQPDPRVSRVTGGPWVFRVKLP